MVVYSNSTCFAVDLKNAVLAKHQVFSLSVLVPYPHTINPGESDTLWLDIKPSSVGPFTDDLLLSLEGSGGKIDTTLTVKAVASAAATLQLMTPKLQFDTVETCTQKDVQF